MLGFQEIICVTVNDPFVLSAWGHAKGADDKVHAYWSSFLTEQAYSSFNSQVRMLADPMATFTRAIGMDVDIPELGGIRSRRYSMATVNGVVKELFVDALNVKLVCLQRGGIPTYCT